MQPDSAALLWDALDAARTIVDFLEEVTAEAYLNDLLRRRAVEREFEIIGEALGKLRRTAPDTAERVPGLRDAVGLRNVLIHGYAEINDLRVYDTAINDVPSLVKVLTVLLAEVESS